VPIAVARDRHRVDREHRASAGAQAGDQQPPVGLDRHRDRVFSVVAGLGQQLQQDREPRRVVADAPLRELFSVSVDQRDVVMILGPVDTAEHCRHRVPLRR
jgi:hypothetical protein